MLRCAAKSFSYTYTCAKSCPTLWGPMDYNLPGSSVHAIFQASGKLEYWSGVPFPTPGDLPDPGIKPESLVSPALAGRFFTPAPPGVPPLLRTYPKKVKTLIQKGTFAQEFIIASFTVASIWKRRKCSPTDKYRRCVHTHTVFSLTHTLEYCSA